MNNESIIRDISQTIGDLIKQFIPDVEISFESPSVSPATKDKRILIYLYQISNDPFLTNTPPVLSPDAHPKETPSLYFDLKYLIIPFGTPDTELILINQIPMILAANPDLKSNIVVNPTPGDEEVIARIMPLQPNMEEMHRLWSLFPNVNYKLSWTYKVMPVRVPLEPQDAGTRVIKPIVDVTLMDEQVDGS